MSLGRALGACKYGLFRWTGYRPRATDLAPDFLGVGVPQGASTWLHAVLSRHPELYLPPGKEVCYFDRRFYRSWAWYEGHFAEAGGRLAGEISPAYCTLSREQLEVLRDVLPSVKILLVLRDPVDRVWSAARRLLGLLDQKDLRSLDEATFRRVVDRPDVRARTDYPAMLERWEDLFPPEQLLVEFYEEVGPRPREVLGRILEHLGASTDIDWGRLGLEERVNVNPRFPIPERLEAILERRYRADVDLLLERFGERVRPWTRRRQRLAEGAARAG